MEIRPGKDNSFECYGADPNSLLDRPEPVVLNLPNSGERNLRCPFLWQTEAIRVKRKLKNKMIVVAYLLLVLIGILTFNLWVFLITLLIWIFANK